MHKLKITITGESVHNVGYRLFLMDEAEARFIPYFDARNTKTAGKQSIVALAGGDEAKVKDFVEYIKSESHENASVSNIEVEDYEDDIRTTDSFRNSFSTHQLFKIANIGVTMLEKQDSMLEKQDKTITELQNVSRTQDTLKDVTEHGFSDLKTITEHGFSDLKTITEHGFSDLKTITEHGFSDLKEEHIRTREISMEIFHSEVQELRQEINSLRSSMEEIKKKVGIA